MKKQNGAWIAIICILVVGISVTNMTKNFVTSETAGAGTEFTAAAAFRAETAAGNGDGGQEAALGSQAGAQAPADGQPAQSAGDEAAAGSQNGDGSPAEGADGGGEDGQALAPASARLYSAADSAPEKNRDSAGLGEPGSAAKGGGAAGSASPSYETALTGDHTSAAAETVKSPLEPGPVGPPLSETAAGAAEVMDAAGFISRLDSIATQIAQSKAGAEESTSASLYMAAQHEWNLWDNELNQIYAAVLSRLDGEEAEMLRQEEIEWIKSRDMAADRAAAKASGRPAQRTSYAEASAQKTKERCYEIVENYRDVLDGGAAAGKTAAGQKQKISGAGT